MSSAFLDPAILFFMLGVGAGLLRSNLHIPESISKFLSLYLLMAIGLKGGFALAETGFTQEVGASLAAAISLALLIPLLARWWLERITSTWNALAIAATYGSVSAVTFVTALAHLEALNIDYGGHMMAALALMESPAILLAMLGAHHLRQRAVASSVIPKDPTALEAAQQPVPSHPLRHVIKEALTEGPQLLLLGAMVVGYLSGGTGSDAMKPFTGDLFKGMLAFFLLDMGLLTARNLPALKGQKPALMLYALVAPLLHASMALGIGVLLELALGNTILLMVLAASASYIAVPAVLRYAIPEASPPLYFGLSLGLTFPFNILIGISLYSHVAQWVMS